MIPPRVRHLLNHLLLKQRGKEMTEIEERICQGIWQNHDYNTIATATGYQPVSVRRLASQLLQELSTATEQKVTKQNFQPIFNQLALDRQSTVDWEDAPTDIQPFCGRIEERSKLAHWISIDRCKLIAIMGIGGIGKTALATKIGQQLQDDFDFVIWRSLREAPPLNQLLGDLIGVLSQHTNLELAKTSPKRIALLLEQLQQHRCLVILDNVEAIMNPGEYAGNYREGYGNYGDLFHRLGSTQHQSCTLITSREPPPEIAELSSDRLPVRTLALRGIDEAGTVLLEKMSVTGRISDLQEINDRCQGNPLYLRIIANTIANNFDGDLAAFLASDRYTYAKISNILTAQLARLTIEEKLLIYCLAIRREPVSIETLSAHFALLNLDRTLPTTIDSLIKRSIVQAIGCNDPISTKYPSKSRPNKRYTLQNVILEFTTDRLLAELQSELAIPAGLFFFNHLAIYPASSPAYIREIQQRLFLQPLARAISQQHQPQALAHLQSLIPLSRNLTPLGYAAGNTIELGHELQADFTGWDLTNLHIAEVDFQAMLLRRVDFRGTIFDRCRFAQALGSIIGLSFSPDGRYLAASDTRFQIKIWEVATNREIAMLVGHQSWVWNVQFSHDNNYLISGSSDETIRIWDVASGECLQVLTGHRDWVWRVNFIFNSQLAVSIGADRQVKIWWWKKAQTLLTFTVPDFRVRDGVFHARRRLLAACGEDGIKIWQIWLGVQVKAIRDSQALNLRLLAFSPDGKKILGANFSRTIHCWDVDTGTLLFDLIGHPTQVGQINFDNTGQIISSCLEQIRVWNLQTGACLRTIDFAADCGKGAAYHAPFIATGSDNGTVKIWNLETGKCISTAGGSAPRMMSLATNPHNSIVASGRDDGTLSLWDLDAHQSLQSGYGITTNLPIRSPLPHPSPPLIKEREQEGREQEERDREERDREESPPFIRGGWGGNSTSNEASVYWWDSPNGETPELPAPITLQAHQGLAGGLAFSPNGKLVASTGSDRIIKVWDALTGEHLHSFEGHTDYVPQLIFADERTIWSRGYDATTRYWDLETGKQEIFTALQPQWVLVLARSIDCQWIAFGTYTPTLAVLHCPTGQLDSYPAEGNRLRQLIFTRDGRSIIGITDDRHLNRWEIDRDYFHTSANIGDRDAMAILSHPLYPHLLICGNDDGTISVWDLDRQIWIERFQAHQQEINSLSFVDRLNRVISCSVDGAIKVWELHNYSLVEVHSIDSIKPYQLMQLDDNPGLNRAQITALIQLGASIDPSR